VKHLTPDELIDAAEGTIDDERQRHLDACEACRKEVEALRALMREAAGAPVPEPSPLFWEHFSARVRQAVAEEQLPSVGWSRGIGWSTLVPVGALAAVMIAMVATLLRAPAVPEMRPAVPTAQISPDDTADVLLEPENWEIVADLLGQVDWETASAAGLTLAPGEAELAVLSLTEDEQRELSRLLAGEIERSKS
jgi:hypothetical protein